MALLHQSFDLLSVHGIADRTVAFDRHIQAELLTNEAGKLTAKFPHCTVVGRANPVKPPPRHDADFKNRFPMEVEPFDHIPLEFGQPG